MVCCLLGVKPLPIPVFIFFYQKRFILTGGCHLPFIIFGDTQFHFVHLHFLNIRLFNTLRRRQKKRHFAVDIFKCNKVNENMFIWFKFHWNMLPETQLIINHHRLRQWLGADQALAVYAITAILSSVHITASSLYCYQEAFEVTCEISREPSWTKLLTNWRYSLVMIHFKANWNK